MNNEEFIDGIKTEVRDSSVTSVIENLLDPPGRKPSKKDMELSDFYKSLSKDQREKIKCIIEESIDMSLFGFFCVLDHVRTIEGVGEKTTFELYAVKNGERVLINDPNKEELHNLYNSLVLEQD